MGSEGRGHELQQQQQQQQPLYMSPQAENLSQMYLLVEKLVKQLQANRQEKQRVLWNVDVLARQLNKKSESDFGKNDIVLFNRFLSQRAQPSVEDTRADLNDSRDKVLELQNERLRKVLEDKRTLNRETMRLLREHEDGLEQVVTLLRGDVMRYHQMFIRRVQKKFNEEMIPREDHEFELYLDNVKEVQELMDISKLYRVLLRLEEQ